MDRPLPARPVRYYRHGLQSWTRAAWIDPAAPVVPISAPQFRAKDEDPLYATDAQPASAWVGAAELPDGQVTLLGALDLGGRVRLEGNSLHGFYETGAGDWFSATGPEEQVFNQYANLLGKRFGRKRDGRAPRVWCSWYSMYPFISERFLLRTLRNLGDLPFDVVQLDDGWQITIGDWQANQKFPSGMAAIADAIRATGRQAGLWLAPLIASRSSGLYRDHPDWVLRDEQGAPVSAGLGWNGPVFALDATHPGVLAFLETTIREVRDWGYSYLKLDFLFGGALPGVQNTPAPREAAYREALRVMRAAAGDAYILACGAPVVPALGLVDGLRVGPDVSPLWNSRPLSTLLNNPNHPGVQNAIRTSLHRLWLRPLVDIDPDVLYFRSRQMKLTPDQKQLLQDLGRISGFIATSDPPHWLSGDERDQLRRFLEETPAVERIDRTRFRIGSRVVDFAPVLSLPQPVRFPPQLATLAGFIQMLVNEIGPAWLEGRRK